jgi:transcriptional antiterminator NusG
MMSHKWYAIMTHSGGEISVKNAITKLVEDLKIQEKLEDIIVPTRDLIEIKKGKQHVVESCIYPGYVFAKLDLDTDLWHRVQSLSKVSKFVGEQKKPVPLSEKDIELIINKASNKEAPKPKVFYDETEVVRIIDGPFANFTGVVEEYDMTTGKLTLNVSIFGRSTPVEIMYNQVEKIV